MLDILDEVLEGEPRYIIRENSGEVLYDNVEISLRTPAVQEGTPINRALFLEIGFHAGMILMWSGSIDTIPKGWALCDGQNGTPDLRNRFIVGAGGTHTEGEIGGNDSITLTVGQLPSHTHTGTTNKDGKHTHTATGAEGDSRSWNTSGSVYPYAVTDTVTTSEHAGHTHAFTTNSTGNGEPIETMPPYYALAYIMKI